MVRQGRLTTVVLAFMIGCALLPLVVGCSGAGSEDQPKEGQGHTEATKEGHENTEATATEQARCEGTRTIKLPRQAEGTFITNDLPGCPKGGLLLGTDKHIHRVDLDQLAGRDGDDEIRGLGGSDMIYGGPGNDVIYGGPGGDMPVFGEDGDDVIYGGPGRDWMLDGNEGEDVIYGGPGNDKELRGGGDGQRDKIYCGKGRDTYTADKKDFVSSSCEKKIRATKSMA